MSDLRGLSKENCIVIIPMYNPDDKSKLVIDGIIESGFTKIVVVNDGSDAEHQAPFLYAKSKSECTVLVHEVNKGKGRALKTAFEYVLKNEPDAKAVVTVDGDNQHKANDVLKCVSLWSENSDSIILGCRNFSKEDIPLRSRFGNKMTSFVFRFFCGLKISDTQTGLRVIPTKYLELMNEVEGDRYEYETNMLLTMKKKKISYLEQTIETVYIDDNETSHFNPILDSLKIYKVILKFAFGSLGASVIDLLMFTISLYVFNNFYESKIAILLATILARIISSICNCLYNKKVVFKSKSSISKVLVRYYTLCVCQTFLSYVGVAGLTKVFGIGDKEILVTIVKMIVDTTLFFVSYFIQKGWVYKEDDKAKN